MTTKEIYSIIFITGIFGFTILYLSMYPREWVEALTFKAGIPLALCLWVFYLLLLGGIIVNMLR